MDAWAETKVCSAPDPSPRGSHPCVIFLRLVHRAAVALQGWYQSLPPLVALHKLCRQVWWLRGEEVPSATTGRLTRMS